MWQRRTCIISLVVLLALIQGGAAFGAWNFLEDPAKLRSSFTQKIWKVI